MKSIIAIAIAATILPPSIAGFGNKAWAGQTYRSEYVVSAIGLRIARTQFSTDIDDGSFTINGTLKSAGVASLFSSMTGTVSVDGRRSGAKTETKHYDIRYTEGKKRRRTTVSYNGNTIRDVSNQPSRKDREKREDWVPHKAGALNGTLDPFTASLVPASSLRDVCNRTLRVFDGVMRADLKLSYVRTIPFSAKGFKGDAVTCRARFEPVSGYQSEKRDITFMRDKSRIEISFAPVGNTGLYAPVAAKAQTRIGEIAMRAVRFETGG